MLNGNWLPVQVRRVIYAVYTLAAIAGIGISAFYKALPDVQAPNWVIGGLAALGALAAPVGMLAWNNTTPQPISTWLPAPDPEPLEPENLPLAVTGGVRWRVWENETPTAVGERPGSVSTPIDPDVDEAPVGSQAYER